jgi:hypothetical protein
MAQTEPMRARNPSARTVRAKCSDELNVSLTSGLPMVRQGLRSLQNGCASLPHYPPPSPKSREAERPGSRKAERRKPGKPGAEKAEMPIMLKPIRRNLVCVPLSNRYATMPYGMPRHNGHVATRTSRVLSSLFSSQSFAFASSIRIPTNPARNTLAHH